MAEKFTDKADRTWVAIPAPDYVDGQKLLILHSSVMLSISPQLTLSWVSKKRIFSS